VLPFVAARPATNIAARVAAPGTAGAVSSAIQLSAYPNPFSSTINLRLTGGTAEKVLISVYSFDSKLVYQTTGSSNSSYTFGSNLLTGVYVVKVAQGNNVQTVKLVKTTN
jgi:hypothetical protein